jgi:hypothetical protein
MVACRDFQPAIVNQEVQPTCVCGTHYRAHAKRACEQPTNWPGQRCALFGGHPGNHHPFA